MGDTVTFNPPGGAVTFAGHGSRIERPDVLPIFWGPYWPGTGSFAIPSIMKEIDSLSRSPYFDGLKQYGYVGPVSIRDPMLISYQPNVTLPVAGPGVQQSKALDTAVRNMINDLLDHDAIGNVDDNHDLIVAVFVDPSIPTPNNASGSNSTIEQFEFLDDNTRFEYFWVSSASNDLPTVLQTFSHELVESISDPFNNGWEQSVPPPPPNQGQIGDVCNQNAIVDGVGVVAYWSIADNACIVPTSGFRRASLSSSTTELSHHDSSNRQAYVDLGKPLCPAGLFDYVERSYKNRITIHADISGYESPSITWTINGAPVVLQSGTVETEAHWERPPASKFARFQVRKATATLHTTRYSPNATEITLEVGPQEGNVVFAVGFSVIESFDVATAGGTGSTTRNASLLVEVKNQEIIWGALYVDAKKNCEHAKHLSDGPNRGVFGPGPGDPPDIAQVLHGLLVDSGPNQSSRLLRAAELVRNFSAELAEALIAHAQRLE